MSSAPTDINMVAVGTAKSQLKGISMGEYPKFVTTVKTILTAQGNLGTDGDKPRFDGGLEPNALHYGRLKSSSILVTEEHLMEIHGLRDEGFKVGDIMLDGLARGKFAAAWKEYRAKARMAISKILLMVEIGSPLYVVMEKASKHGDPNAVIAAAELFYNSKTFPTLLSIVHGEIQKLQELKERKKASAYDQYTGLRQIFRNTRRLFNQVFSDAERSDPASCAKIDDLWHFCRQVVEFESWLGDHASLINFISLNVRQTRESPIEFNISDFWESFDQHASVSRTDNSSNKKHQSPAAVPAVTPLSQEAKELATLKKHIHVLVKSKGRNQKAAHALGFTKETFKRQGDHGKPDGDDGVDSKKAKVTCYSWRDKGKCRYGSKCKFEHEGAKATVNAFSVPLATDDSDRAEFDEPYGAELAMFSGIEALSGDQPQWKAWHRHSGDEACGSEDSDEPIDIFTVCK